LSNPNTGFSCAKNPTCGLKKGDVLKIHVPSKANLLGKIFPVEY